MKQKILLLLAIIEWAIKKLENSTIWLMMAMMFCLIVLLVGTNMDENFENLSGIAKKLDLASEPGLPTMFYCLDFQGCSPEEGLSKTLMKFLNDLTWDHSLKLNYNYLIPADQILNRKEPIVSHLEFSTVLASLCKYWGVNYHFNICRSSTKLLCYVSILDWDKENMIGNGFKGFVLEESNNGNIWISWVTQKKLDKWRPIAIVSQSGIHKYSKKILR